MQQMFLTGLTKDQAELISSALFALTRPTSVRGSEDTTVRLLEVVEHPDGLQAALVFPAFIISINRHPDVLLSPPSEILESLDFLPLTDQEKILEYILQNEKLKLEKLIPDSLKDNVKTAYQLKILGWFNEN